MRDKRKQERLSGQIYMLFLFSIGVIFLLFFSISTSPLTSNFYGTDSAFFQMAGQSMVKGKVMYLDIFDNKGPYLFLIQYLGQIICYGRYGIFLIQLISMFISLYFMDCICQMLCGRNYSFRIYSAIIFFFIWSFTLDCGNLSEEYSLPVLFFCLYLFFKFLNGEREKPFSYSIVIGASFGFLAFIRITNASFICVLVATLLTEFILNRQFTRVFICMIGFCIGFLISCLPIGIFYVYKHALFEMLYCTFMFNFLYAVKNPGIARISVILILVVTAFLSLCINMDNRVYCLFSFYSMIVTSAILLLGNAYIHYYQMIIPPVLGNAWLIMRKYQRINLRHKKLIVSLIILILMILNVHLVIMHGGRVAVALGLNSPKMEATFLGALAHSVEKFDTYGQGTYGYVALERISDILEHIPKNSYNEVYNYNTKPLWLRVSGILPYNKYCQTQESFISINPQIEDEIDYMFEVNPPKYIVLEDYDGITSRKIKRRLNLQYIIKYKNSVYTLFELKNKAQYNYGDFSYKANNLEHLKISAYHNRKEYE